MLHPPVSVVSPLKADRFAKKLRHHHDKEKVAYMIQGLHHGFQLGFSRPQTLQPANHNKLSAYEHPTVINENLANEEFIGRVTGPFNAPPIASLHISSFGVVPKKSQPGKWLMVDLSSPTVGPVSTTDTLLMISFCIM